jgi:hypothetical protein
MHSEHARWAAKVMAGLVDRGDCWTWVGGRCRGGYGQFRRKVEGKWRMYKAHRYAYEHYKGPIPKGLLVRHKCDNAWCVNPEHLELGTSKDNTQDIIKRRGPILIRNPRHNNLNPAIARAIRFCAKARPDIKQTELASHFGTSKAQVSRILRNEIWKEEN